MSFGPALRAPAAISTTALAAPPNRALAPLMAERVIFCLSRHRFRLTDEKRPQAEIAEALEKDHLPFEREVRLEPGSIIDFMVGDVGLEVKIQKGQKQAIFRQCERYCGLDRVKAIVLATNLAMGFPSEIAGKPAYIFPLGKAWL